MTNQSYGDFMICCFHSIFVSLSETHSIKTAFFKPEITSQAQISVFLSPFYMALAPFLLAISPVLQHLSPKITILNPLIFTKNNIKQVKNICPEFPGQIGDN